MGLAIALLILAAALGAAVELFVGNRATYRLAEQPATVSTGAPRVSIVVAARDEAHTIGPALESLLALDYPDLEVIAIDDRSTDATGAILDDAGAREPRLHVVHVDALPEGWLGKNHALQRGAEAATGELILFTDADVVFEPTALRRAVGYLQRHGLDHLAGAPQLTMPGTLLGMFGVLFMATLALFARPWRARQRGSRWHIGIGAFNLVRAEAYRAVGGHHPIALRPDDDLKLGKLLKTRGFLQDVVNGRGMIHVEWYSSVGQVVRGLRKNTLAGVDYRLWLVLIGALAQVLLHLWPPVAVLVLGGATRLIYGAVILVLLAAYADTARENGARMWHAAGYPLAALILVYTVVAATARTLRRGGIEWRGTFYSLEELRANVV